MTASTKLAGAVIKKAPAGDGRARIDEITGPFDILNKDDFFFEDFDIGMFPG